MLKEGLRTVTNYMQKQKLKKKKEKDTELKGGNRKLLFLMKAES